MPTVPRSPASPDAVSAPRIAVARLAHQGLIRPPAHTMAATVVRALGALQAQDHDGAVWAIGLRAAGLTRFEVERAADSGDIVRTHVLRPTWHFVAAPDVRWMQRLTAPRVKARMAAANRALGLTPAVIARSHGLIERELGGHRPRTRRQLATALSAAGIVVEGTQRLAHLVMEAELDALICSGPRAGVQPTYMLLAERIPMSTTLDWDEALAELTRRYIMTRAPATVHDFAWWSGLTIAACRRGLACLGREVLSQAIDGITYHVPRGFTLPRATNRTVHLLPNYDEFFIGFKDRRAIAHGLRDLTLVTGGNALIGHVVLIGGQLVGAWRRVPVNARAVADVTLHLPISEAERAQVHAAVARFATW